MQVGEAVLLCKRQPQEDACGCHAVLRHTAQAMVCSRVRPGMM